MRFWAVMLAMLVAATLSAFAFRSALAVDFLVYWNAAITPVELVYSRPNQPFVNPPTALALLKPLGLLPALAAFLIYTAVALSPVLAVAWREMSLRVMALVGISPIMVQALWLGQISVLLGAFVMLGFVSGSAVVGGLSLGLVAAVKPQMVLLAPLALIVRRDWSRLTWAGVGLAALLVAELVFYGPQLWFDWISALSHLREQVAAQGLAPYGAAPSMLAARFGFAPLPFLLLGMGLGVAAVVLNSRRYEGLTLAGLVVAGSALSVPYALPHDLIAGLPVAAMVALSGPPVAALVAILFLAGQFTPFILMGAAAWLIASRIPAVTGEPGSRTCHP